MTKLKYTAPETPITGEPYIFLAGTIDNGNSEDWQERFSNYFAKEGWRTLNPRRKDWNSATDPILENKNFKQQVEWEANGLELAEVIVFNFLENSLSPVSLLELGEFGSKGHTAIHVICPRSYFRRGNVEHFCSRQDYIQLFDSEQDFFTNYKEHGF